MSEDKIVNGYYQSNIKTSRNEDSVYAMKYASQQMIIDKLQNNWNELKEWLEQIQDYHIGQRGLVDNEFNYALESEDIDVLSDVLHKMQEIESGKVD